MMTTNINNPLTEYDFHRHTRAGLIICAGGFESRSLSFANRLRKSRCSVTEALILQYESQKQQNEPNCQYLKQRLAYVVGKNPDMVSVHADTPIQSSGNIKRKIHELASKIMDQTALVDISGMTHLWALSTIHACLSCGFRTFAIYTEARWYYPPKRELQRVVHAWRNNKYDIAAKYLQSAGLKAIHILPDFAGNFRPGKPTCLMTFVGYEPNRIEGLVDDYSPGALVVFYGKSPHQELHWRTELSKRLHEELFASWFVRETETSTLLVDNILRELDHEFRYLQETYDVAIAPQCSKIQALAAYIFWRQHPEVQLLFTSPVKFNPDHYSHGARRTFVYQVVF